MEIRNLQSWDEFENEIRRLLESHANQKKLRLGMPDYVFRGQADSSWELKTTMERSMGGKRSMSDYYALILDVKNRIETFTNTAWIIPDYPAYLSWLEHEYKPYWGSEPLAYDYMIYLRHHGFPSPLLDWSLSPYVAAYFAFQDLQHGVESVAIYAYLDRYGAKSISNSGPHIRLLGAYVTTDKRHFLQQCEYTICTEFEENQAYYLSHEDVFSKPNSKQGILHKFVLPLSERKKALKALEMFNINAFSLFGSEESLMQTMFLREFVLK